MLRFRVPQPRAALVLLFDGDVVRGHDATDLVSTLLVRAFGFDGRRDRLGPFCAWLAAECGFSVDAALPDDRASDALVDGLVANGHAERL